MKYGLVLFTFLFTFLGTLMMIRGVPVPPIAAGLGWLNAALYFYLYHKERNTK